MIDWQVHSYIKVNDKKLLAKLSFDMTIQGGLSGQFRQEYLIKYKSTLAWGP